VTFYPDRINVVTGQSERGKSALLWIVDYCLGSRRCSIPVGVIRESTSWFGLLLDLGETQMLVARREPGAQAQTGAAYMEEGVQVPIPRQIEPNCTTTDVRDRLGQLGGLPALDLDGGEGKAGGFRGRPSSRDMATFNFLPQHIVANPYTLFFKADTYEHQERLKALFPLVLGATDARSLEWKRELKELERELERAKSALAAQQASASVWVSELRSTYEQARELGLLPEAPPAGTNWTYEMLIAQLNSVIERVGRGEAPIIALGATEEAASRLATLRAQEADVARKIAALRRKLAAVRELDTTTDEYAETLRLQQDRIEPVGWFAEAISKGRDHCPFCGSDHAPAEAHIQRLVRVGEQLGRAVSALEPANRVLDRERTGIQTQLRELEQELNGIRTRRKEWEDSQERAGSQRQTLPEVFRFVGRLEHALTTYQGAYSNTDAVQSVRVLQNRIERLRQAVNPRQEQERVRRSLEELTGLIDIYARIIGVDPTLPPPNLDLTNLTLEFKRNDGRSDRLWEIGSGGNWMGYHIATYLALHEFFLQKPGNPVASFLMIDQPSQAFFPDRWPGDPDPETGEIPIPAGKRSNDIDRVTRIFKALAEANRRTGRKLQIIVVDHADEITWYGIREVQKAERWRDEDALIPASWITHSKGVDQNA
jgi:hypothetical protein